MVGVAVVDVLPDFLHFANAGYWEMAVVELAIGTEEFGLEGVWGGAGDDAGEVHAGVGDAGEAEVDDADDFVLVVY